MGILISVGTFIAGTAMSLLQSAASAALVGAIIYAVLGTLAESMASIGMSIGQALITTTINTFFTADGNCYNTIVKFVLPADFNVNVGNIMMTIATGIVTLSIVFAGLKSVFTAISGEQSESVQSAIAHAIVALLLIYAFFGTFTWTGGKRGVIVEGNETYIPNLLSIIFNMFGLLIKAVGVQDIETISSINLSLPGANASGYLLGCIMTASILTASLTCAISYIERILSFAIYVILGPIALSMYAWRDTRRNAIDWIVGLFAQIMAIFISTLMWYAFFKFAVSNYVESNAVTEGSAGLFINLSAAEGVFKVIIGVVLLTMCSRSEQFLNSIGLRTMPSTDAAREALGGAYMLAKVAGKAGDAAKSIGKSAPDGARAAGYAGQAYKNATKAGDSALGGAKKAWKGAMADAKETRKNADRDNLKHPENIFGNMSSAYGKGKEEANKNSSGGATVVSDSQKKPIDQGVRGMSSPKDIEKRTQGATNAANAFAQGRNFDAAKHVAGEDNDFFNTQDAMAGAAVATMSESGREAMKNSGDPRLKQTAQNYEGAVDRGANPQNAKKTATEAVNKAFATERMSAFTNSDGVPVFDQNNDFSNPTSAPIKFNDEWAKNATPEDIKEITNAFGMGVNENGQAQLVKFDSSNLENLETKQIMDTTNELVDAINSRGYVGDAENVNSAPTIARMFGGVDEPSEELEGATVSLGEVVRTTTTKNGTTVENSSPGLKFTGGFGEAGFAQYSTDILTKPNENLQFVEHLKDTLPDGTESEGRTVRSNIERQRVDGNITNLDSKIFIFNNKDNSKK